MFVRLTPSERAMIDRRWRASGQRSRAHFIRSRLLEAGSVSAHELVLEMNRLTVTLKAGPPELYARAVTLLEKALDVVVRT
jgi:hypothetical protein